MHRHKMVDEDRTGNIEFGEFMAWWVEYALTSMFTRFDTGAKRKGGEKRIAAASTRTRHIHMRNRTTLLSHPTAYHNSAL